MKKIISIILAVLMLLATLSCLSCKKEQQGDETASNSVSTVEGEPQGLFYTAGQAEIDKYGLDGYEVNLYARSLDSEWSVSDIAVGENHNPSNAVDAAVYARELELKEKFGFTMKVHYSPDTYVKALQTQLDAGECEFDLAFPMAYDAQAMATKGQLFDLKSLEHFDVDNGAWTKMFCDNLEWQGKLYFAVGGISVTNSYNAIRCFMFNKSIASEIGYGDIYQIVYDGEWTLETMNTMAISAAKDSGDGMSIKDNEDQWGLVWQKAVGGLPLFYGSGELVAKNNADGLPELSLGNERSHDVFRMVQMMISNSNVYYQGVDEDIRDAFSSGRTLFFTEVLNTLQFFRDAEEDFGLLPLPKYDEEQENYVQYVDGWCPSTVVIPTAVQNPNRSSFLAQLLAETGMEKIKPEYYDRTLSYILVRDADSHNMLETITQNFVLDASDLYGWGGLSTEFVAALNSGEGLASVLASKTGAFNAAVAQTADAYAKIN